MKFALFLAVISCGPAVTPVEIPTAQLPPGSAQPAVVAPANDERVAASDDRDNDGILDDVDKCPDDPEDRDGFEDEDGCPDPDNDRDGIADVNDKCPNEPETYNGYEDDDGCPDYARIRIVH